MQPFILFGPPMLESDRLLESIGPQLQTNLVVPLKLSVALAHAFWRERDQENRAVNRNIVNLSSTAGLKIYHNLNQSIYSASKAALNFLTRHMADEFRPIGLRVNAVAPNTFPRIVSTESVVAAVRKLDSDSATGKILVLDSDGEHLT
jgi:NAD(P)-dependent dehydrogenase (short-subunit alcohol dehydrogenase family)